MSARRIEAAWDRAAALAGLPAPETPRASLRQAAAPSPRTSSQDAAWDRAAALANPT